MAQPRPPALSTARASLSLSEETFRLFIESVRDYAMFLLDPQGIVTSWNAGAERIKGYKASDIIGRHFSTFYPAEDVNAGKCEYELEGAARDGRFEDEGWRVRKDGTLLWANVVITALKDEHGALLGFAKVTRDLTERRHAEQERIRAAQVEEAHRIKDELIAAEREADARDVERRAMLADATGALNASLDYGATLANAARAMLPKFADFCAVHLTSPGEAPRCVAVAHPHPEMERRLFEILGSRPAEPQSLEGIPAVVHSGLAQLYSDIGEEQLARRAVDPQHLAQLRALGLKSAIIAPLSSGRYTLGAISFFSTDESRRYGRDEVGLAEEFGRRVGSAIENARLYEAEQRAREAADSANRAKDDFLAAISHELRTPLNAILGWAKLLSMGLDETKRERAARTIERNAEAMNQLIEDLLDVSRIVAGKLRLDIAKVDVASVIDAALESIRPAADAKRIQISHSLEAQAAEILGDATRLQQVVWNLLTNAVKFTPEGGSVSVALRQKPAELELTVADTGKGIAAGFVPHVFDPFRQGDTGITRTSRGLGLGLAISRTLAELHGGSIDARSEGEGRGATFIVRLPLPTTGQGAMSSTGADVELGSPQLRGSKILVVEDDPDARELLQIVLEQHGASVQVASNVADALEKFERDPPDILLSDIGLPDASGYDLIRRIRALPPERGGNVPAAALTAFARAEDRRLALSAGYLLHVAKPVEPKALLSVVAALARQVPRR